MNALRLKIMRRLLARKRHRAERAVLRRLLRMKTLLCNYIQINNVNSRLCTNDTVRTVVNRIIYRSSTSIYYTITCRYLHLTKYTRLHRRERMLQNVRLLSGTIYPHICDKTRSSCLRILGVNKSNRTRRRRRRGKRTRRSRRHTSVARSVTYLFRSGKRRTIRVDHSYI